MSDIIVRNTFASVLAIYAGSKADETKALYGRLNAMGASGAVAINLFRACKTSERAKLYRGGKPGGGSFRSAAYETKGWAIANLCASLPATGLSWGWGIDEKLQKQSDPHHFVLYVDLPSGQVSFHNGYRGAGPDYGKSWDGIEKQGPTRICRWVAELLEGRALP